MSTVTRRQVWRFFTPCGKGFATETAAYKWMAKRELGKIMAHRIDNLMSIYGMDPMYESATKEIIREAYSKMFPPENDGYPFSKRLYKEWIEAKIKELRAVSK